MTRSDMTLAARAARPTYGAADKAATVSRYVLCALHVSGIDGPTVGHKMQTAPSY